MKHFALFVGLLLICNTLFGQVNLIPNGSFEDTITCPTNLVQVTSACADWSQYTSATPDYFNACAAGSGIGLPSNVNGYQPAYHGQAYVGLVAHTQGSSWYEYIEATLLQPLVPGKVYQSTMYVSRSNYTYLATDNLGMSFYDTGAASITGTAAITRNPQIYYDNYGTVQDTQNWVRLSKLFIADSAYDHVVIGGFTNANNTYNIDTTSTPGGTTVYYYIDSVSVRQFDTFYVTMADSMLCAGDTFTVDYVAEILLGAGNVFTMQLSDASGSFATPVNIGTVSSDTFYGSLNGVVPANLSPGSGYRLRVISSQTADTSSDNGIDISIGNIDSVNVSVSANDTLCTNDTLNFTASASVSSTTYLWAGPSGFNTTKADTSIYNPVVSNSGKYYSTVKFYGCEVKDTFDVLVKQSPAIPVATSNTPVCEPDTLQISATTNTNGVNYSWSGPNSFSDTGATVIIPVSADTMSGVYTATVTKNGCSSSDTTNVVVKPLPDTITLSNNTPLCEGDTLKLFSDTSTIGVIYTWSGPQSFSKNTRNVTEPNTAPNMTGWYTMTVDLNGCQYLDSTQVNIYAVPASPVVTYDTFLCVGDTLNLTANSLTGATYNWTGPNNFSSNQKSPVITTVTLNDTGTYTVIATNNICSSPAASVDVKINPQPFVVMFGNKDSICDGEQVTFTALANNTGAAPTYQWYVNAQTVGTGTTYLATNLKHNDIIRVDMTEYTNCKNPYTDESNDIRMTVLPWLAPSVSIMSDKAGLVKPYEYITFTATPVDAGNNPRYQWKRNGTDVIGAQSYIWSANTLNDNDSVSVDLISSYQCPQPTTAVSNGIVVRILTTIGEIDGLEDLKLYPNPNDGQFVLEGTVEGSGKYTIDVVNSIGQLVHHDNLSVTSGKLHHSINLRQISSGIYMLKLTDYTGNSTTIRFRVE